MNDLQIGNSKEKALIIAVGPPASGKSTWAKKFAKDNNIDYVATDEIRAEIGSGEGDQSVSAAAFGIAKQRVISALTRNKSVIIDATNVNPKSRKQWIKIGRDLDAYIIAVAFEVSRDELLRRNAKRERQVPPDVVDSFINRYQRPTDNEVDKVIVK